jgi:hypothetical protein
MDSMLEITLTGGEYRVDSRLVARSLGTEREREERRMELSDVKCYDEEPEREERV